MEWPKPFVVEKKNSAIVDYNKGKQAIDLLDQMISYFTPLRKTIRWYQKEAFELPVEYFRCKRVAHLQPLSLKKKKKKLRFYIL